VQVGVSAANSFATTFTPQTPRAASTSPDFAAIYAARTSEQRSQAGISPLTDDDKAVIRAATGISLYPDGSVAENLSGEFPDWGTINQIKHDREEGILKGPITSDYIKTVTDRLPPNMQESAQARNLSAALDFLLKRESNTRSTAYLNIVA
jgi:hypothetical protein